MPVTLVSEGQPLSLLDDQVNTALVELLTKFSAASGPVNTYSFQDWVDNDDPNCPWTIRNDTDTGWSPYFAFKGGYRHSYCDDAGETIEFGAPATGIVAGGYRLKLPLAAPVGLQSMRLLSGDATQLEWYTPAGGVTGLSGLSDVDSALAPADGEILKYVTANNRFEAVAETGGGASSLGGLSDVTIASAASGHLLVRDATDFKNRVLVAADIPDLSATYLPTATVLSGLADVSAASPTTGDLLKWNGGAWVDGTVTLAELSAHVLAAPLTIDNQNQLRLAELDASGSAYVALRAPADLTGAGGGYTLTYPAADPAANQVQVSDAAGALSWATFAFALDDLTDVTTGTPVAGALVYYDGTNYAVGLTIDEPAPTFQTGLSLGGSAAVAGVLRLYEISGAGSNFIAIDVQAALADTYTIRVPATTPTAGQVWSVQTYSNTIAAMEWKTLAYFNLMNASTGAVTTTGPEALSLVGGDGVDTVANDATNTITIDLQIAGQADGVLLYRTGGVWSSIPIGSEAQVLTVVSGRPLWATPAA